MPVDGSPNLVLVVLDTLTARAAGLGHSPVSMPRTESLGGHGLVFSHAISNAPWTYPAHASLFTGLLPSEHGMEVPLLNRLPGGPARRTELIRKVASAAPERRPYLAERWLPAALSRGGYETVLVSNNPWVGRHSHMDYGFDVVVDIPFFDFFRPPKILRRFRRLRVGMRAASFASRIWRGGQDLRARTALSKVAEWMQQRDTDRPFFLFVNLIEAHSPYLTPRSRKAVRAARAGPATTYRAMRLIDPHKSFRFNLGMPLEPDPAPAFETLRSLHRHAAGYLDERVQELHDVCSVDGRGLVLCVTSDHGDSFGDHHALFHGITLNEPILHVPLVLAGDGVASGERRDTVDLRAVYSTLMAAAGLEVPVGSPPPLTDNRSRVVIAERDRTQVPAGFQSAVRFHERLGRLRAVYRDPWKLVVTSEGSRLFDLSEDPDETTDLAAQRPDTASSLEAALPPWPEPGEAPAGQAEEGPPPVSPEEEAEMAERLAALGYLG